MYRIRLTGQIGGRQRGKAHCHVQYEAAVIRRLKRGEFWGRLHKGDGGNKEYIFR